EVIYYPVNYQARFRDPAARAGFAAAKRHAVRKPAFMKERLGRLFLRLHFKAPSARRRHREPGPGTIASPFVFTAILVFERRASFPSIKKCEIPARKGQFISGEESEPANQWEEQFSKLEIATSLSANNFKRSVSKFSIISNVFRDSP